MNSEKVVQEILREAVSPPGFGKTVEHMKKHKEITNPFALSWYMYNKGDEPHYKEDKKKKKSK